MRAIVMGGGKVGSYLARELRAAGESVIVMEHRPDVARRVAEETGALTMEGDGTDIELLGDLDLRRTDFFVAVTGADEVNLVACQLARSAFGVERVLARLNDPRNRATFDALTIPVVSVTDLLVQVISRELDVRQLARVALLDRGEVSLFEVEIPEDGRPAPLPGVAMPEESVVAVILREGETLVPHAASEIRPLDRVLVVSRFDLEDEARDALLAATAALSTADGMDIVRETEED
jgi:trk system potassium uptake protein